MSKKSELGGPPVKAGDRIRILKMWTTNVLDGKVATVRGVRHGESYDSPDLSDPIVVIDGYYGSTFVTKWEIPDESNDPELNFHIKGYLAKPEVSHYQPVGGGPEPWDLIHSLELNFDEGNVIKYVARHRRKNGLEDLRKALDYLKALAMDAYGEEL